MLSRVADSMYWMSRYVERAENVARSIDVNLQLLLDASPSQEQQWQPLIDATADQEEFAERHGVATRENVIEFLAFDPRNPNSILSCLRMARENARGVREGISSAMWLELNKFYLVVKAAAAAPIDLDQATEFFDGVKRFGHLFSGITDSTMTHGTGWLFSQIGRMIERADKVSRILDMNRRILLASPEDAGTTSDQIHWGAVLRSASAFEMYSKRHGRITPSGVIEFLMLDREFPRSIQFCLRSARESLHRISGTAPGTYRYTAERLLGQICSELAFATVDDIIQCGLHEYVDQFQTKLNQTSQAIFDRFFAFQSTPMSNPNPAVKLLAPL